jgi:nicotinate-nucleotide adenylyltransferase
VTDGAGGDAVTGESALASTSAAPWIDPADRRVGILGGTFDPIHFGHLIIADEVREALQLDRVLFIPAAMPPHKLAEHLTPAVDRAAMVQLAIADNPGFSMSPIELERSGPSYTVDTLSDLAGEAARQGVDREFHFILSLETLAWFKSWHEPARLLKLARLAVVARPGAPMPVGRHLGALLPGGAASMGRVECIETMLIAHSASDVRARVASGRSIRYLVPPAVEAYIRDHRLYLSDNSMRTA